MVEPNLDNCGGCGELVTILDEPLRYGCSLPNYEICKKQEVEKMCEICKYGWGTVVVDMDKICETHKKVILDM